MAITNSTSPLVLEPLTSMQSVVVSRATELRYMIGVRAGRGMPISSSSRICASIASTSRAVQPMTKSLRAENKASQSPFLVLSVTAIPCSACAILGAPFIRRQRSPVSGLAFQSFAQLEAHDLSRSRSGDLLHELNLLGHLVGREM